MSVCYNMHLANGHNSFRWVIFFSNFTWSFNSTAYAICIFVPYIECKSPAA